MSSYHFFLFQHTLDPSGHWTAHLNLGDTYIDTVLANAWYVDWVRISTEDSDLKKQFNCNVAAWLQRGGDLSYTIISNCQEMDESKVFKNRAQTLFCLSARVTMISIKNGNQERSIRPSYIA